MTFILRKRSEPRISVTCADQQALAAALRDKVCVFCQAEQDLDTTSAKELLTTDCGREWEWTFHLDGTAPPAGH